MNTEQQPEALRLADRLRNEYCDSMAFDAAKELCRLHAENQQLRAEVQRLTLYASGADMLVGVWKARAQEFMNSSDRLRAEMEAIGAGGVGSLIPAAHAKQHLDMGEQEPDEFCEWWAMRPSLTRLQAWLIWEDEHKQPKHANGIGQEGSAA